MLSDKFAFEFDILEDIHFGGGAQRVYLHPFSILLGVEYCVVFYTLSEYREVERGGGCCCDVVLASISEGDWE